ncbi:MAG: O-methyltransferase [Pseudomonadota bacterium]
MHPSIRRLANAVLGPVLRTVARAGVAADSNGADPVARRLLGVVRRTLRGDFSAEEQAWFVRIEAMRTALSASDEAITLVDYGAGGPNDTRSAEEMRRGTPFASTVGAVCRLASKPPFWARLLFAILREYRPRRGVELGTCLAVSASYQGAAMLLNGDGGTLHTLEGADALAARSRRNLDGLALANVTVVAGRFDQTLDGVLRGSAPLDYAFIDGHHDEQATIDYFRQLLPFLAPGAVLVFDDISWSPGMKRAWQAISADERVQVAVDLRAVGICVLGSGGVRSRYRYFLP